MKLPAVMELDDPPVLSEVWMTLTESSSISPSILGRKRAAILTLSEVAMSLAKFSGGGRRQS